MPETFLQHLRYYAMSRLNKNISAQSEEGSRYFTVHRPGPHDGLGRALRNAFRHQDGALPPDLADLMGTLNHIRQR